MSLSLPVVAVASLTAADFKALSKHHPKTHRAVMRWLQDITPFAPSNAYQHFGVVLVNTIEATNQAPWWRCLAIKTDPATGEPARDPESENLFQSFYFTPAMTPPPELVEALDEMSGHKLAKRIDGGPTPSYPGGQTQ